MQFKKEWLIPIGVGVGSFGLGGAVGHILTKYKLDVNIEKDDDDEDPKDIIRRFEFDDAKKEFTWSIQQANHVVNKFMDALGIMAENQATLIENSVSSHPSNGQLKLLERMPGDIPPPVSIFKEKDDDWDYNVEIMKRNPDNPYIIHRDEFFEKDENFTQSSLMYYEGDDILCDEKDVPIYDKERVVGELNFGHGSHDPSICYVRNEKLEAEYEVILDHGFYQVEVLGTDAEDVLKSKDLKHTKLPRKFRQE